MIRNGYKKCNKCLVEWYPAERFFSPDRRAADGLTSYCKSCRNMMNRKRHALDPEKHRAMDRRYRLANPEKVKERHRLYRHHNPEKVRESVRIATKRWRENNPEKYREKYTEANRLKNKIPKNRLSNCMRSGMIKSLKNGKCGKSWESLVGYTCDDLMNHLESQFKKGMTWENQGEWHIDHIRPVSDFNFTTIDDPEFLECWSLWNLQPMWANDNWSKQAKCESPPLPLITKGAEQMTYTNTRDKPTSGELSLGVLSVGSE